MYDDLVKRLRSTYEADYFDHGVLLEAADAIEELSATVSKMENTRWIPVTERLPEFGEYVLAYLFNRSPYIAWIDRTGQWQTEEFWLDAEDAPKAWMPIPEPYEPPKEE